MLQTFTWASAPSPPRPWGPDEDWCRLFLSDEDWAKLDEKSKNFPLKYRERFFSVMRGAIESSWAEE